ncbi:glycine--tRNA ligase subunit beta [Sphingobium boeckii]|uniref:Glycine--tRNA ligase beta subunit n=1 Tax=Sphingobium boeckii TaxID=1082345 RepID=A0A7W9AKC5_9SPHN|nr:glycine--tRNA ligase subunit beta [Sphingobium boeckii]MBB5687057.1 glycyl-tRNA synthetase beta chain [Sphingobium boeckii]
MTDFLLELRCEEIAARMQVKASDDLARLFAEELAKAGLKPASIESFVTPRRLALIARGLPAQTEAVSEERKGPRADAPEQALAGFLRSTGLTREQLVERPDAKGVGILFAVIEKPGRATADVLAEAVPAIVRAFPWPKSMRWGAASQTTESLRWVRPLQGIVALFGDDLVPLEIDGLASGYTTVGHRFHHHGEITIGNADDYAVKLRAAHVIVSHKERQAIIAEKAAEAAASKGYTLIEDQGLVAENAGLTEWPVPLIGAFDPAFLEVPPEVIQLTLRINQKYFVLRDGAGKLAPAFICTANIEAKDGGAAIVAGNRKVLAARLSDARFFWEQDKKTRLEDHAKKLERITFHEKLGTVADKVERVAKLARWLVEEGIVGGENTSGTSNPVGVERSRDTSGAGDQRPSTLRLRSGEPSLGTNGDLADLAEQAARLAKADLVTEMVGEFPELQGVMGGYYARAEGLPDAVADAIRDHYKPVGQGDDVPTAPVTVAVSLADKLDTIVGFFAAGEQPTGSKDPYAIRRAVLGILRTIQLGDYRVLMIKVLARAATPILGQLLEEPYLSNYDAHNLVGRGFVSQKPYLDDNQKITGAGAYFRSTVVHGLPALASFFADRLKVQQREAGVRHDLIDAVFALGGEDDLVRLLARVKALQAFVETGEGANLLAGYKRAANILKKEGFSNPSPPSGGEGGAATAAEGEGDRLVSGDSPRSPAREARRPSPPEGGEGYAPEPAEAALLAALDAAEPAADAAIQAENFEGAMAALASLRAPIDAFFEHVTVNDVDPAKRAARLGMLARVRDAVHRVADFSKIEG